MNNKKEQLSFSELKEYIDGTPWDDQDLCDAILRRADPSDLLNADLIRAAGDLLTAMSNLESLLEDLEIERG